MDKGWGKIMGKEMLEFSLLGKMLYHVVGSMSTSKFYHGAHKKLELKDY